MFISAGVIPPFAVGCKRLGEFVSGGSANPSLQALAVALRDAHIEGGFLLTFWWVPRELNVREDGTTAAASARSRPTRWTRGGSRTPPTAS